MSGYIREAQHGLCEDVRDGPGDFQRKSLPGSRHSPCKGPGAALGLVCWRTSKGVCVAGAEVSERERGRTGGEGGHEAGQRGFGDHGENLGSH